MQPELDPFAISEAFADLNAAWRHDPDACQRSCSALTQAMLSAGEKVLAFLRNNTPDGAADCQQALLQWVRNLAWSGQQYHQVLNDWMTGYIENAPALDPATRMRALFWMRQIAGMLAPGNFFWANPKAVQRFIESRGESLNHGLDNWLEDQQTHRGLVNLADRTKFEVGRNLATTPGHVVFRNHLMELIQYSAQTDTVRQVPIVLIQPWINKYYIFDLSAQNSFASYLVRQGFSVFITSWKNPGPDMRGTTFEDYLRHGALPAVKVASRICASAGVHAAGYCIGGTLLAVLLGWLAAQGSEASIADATLFATLLDFSDPGDLGSIIHPSSVEAIEQLAAAKGVLEAHHIATAFRLLNPDDLIWRYVVNNYFFGEPPPRSDMLFWNSDGTNLPQAMCTQFLRWFYLDNRLVRPNALTVGGHAIDLRGVRQPLYVVGSAKDHICPWPSTFKTCRLVGGKVRYVLADEGHITGIVNPASPWSRKQYWAGPATRRRNGSRWLEKLTPNKGSWWPDWVAWLTPRSGERVPPPAPSSAYPPLAPAPGTYVCE
jgi:polyhydroxyalkanoate synthase